MNEQLQKPQIYPLPQLHKPHSWLSSRSIDKSSHSSQLIDKVPKQIRSSLKHKKQIQNQNININNFYQGFKNVLTSQSVTCAICLNPITNQCSISDCSHIFCAQCIASYMTYKINSMQQIICPNQQCNRNVSFNSSGWKSLPQQYKQKYQKQQLWRQTIKNPDLRLCPIQQCKQGTINLLKIPPTCQKCHTIFCKQCMMKQHPKTPCDQNFKLNFKEWKRCPNCQMFIQKTQGCNHMVCRCKHQFCFICLCNWTNDHYSCVGQRQDWVQTEGSCCSKMTAILMILAIPLLAVFALVIIVLAMGILIIIGFVAGVVFSLKYLPDVCICLGVIFCPLVGLIVAIVALIQGQFFYLIPIIRQYFNQYIRNIRNLWRHRQAVEN